MNYFWDLSFPFEASDDSISDCTTPRWSSESWAESSGFSQGKRLLRKYSQVLCPAQLYLMAPRPRTTLVTGPKAWEHHHSGGHATLIPSVCWRIWTQTSAQCLPLPSQHRCQVLKEAWNLLPRVVPWPSPGLHMACERTMFSCTYTMLSCTYTKEV